MNKADIESQNSESRLQIPINTRVPDYDWTQLLHVTTPRRILLLHCDISPIFPPANQLSGHHDLVVLLIENYLNNLAVLSIMTYSDIQESS